MLKKKAIALPLAVSLLPFYLASDWLRDRAAARMQYAAYSIWGLEPKCFPSGGQGDGQHSRRISQVQQRGKEKSKHRLYRTMEEEKQELEKLKVRTRTHEQ